MARHAYKPVASSNHPLNRTCVGWSLEISFNDAGTDAENDPAAIKQANGGKPLTDLYNGYRKISRILGHQTSPPSLRALQQRNLPLATLYYPGATACTTYWVCNCSWPSSACIINVWCTNWLPRISPHVLPSFRAAERETVIFIVGGRRNADMRRALQATCPWALRMSN